MNDVREGAECQPVMGVTNNTQPPCQEDRASVTSTLLGRQLQALVDRITGTNVPGNLDGLFAYYIVGSESAFPLTWNVNCATEEWLGENATHLNNYPTLAAIGYSLRDRSTTAAPAVQRAFLGGLQRLRRRDPLPEDRISFAYQPKAFLGLALGVAQLHEADTEYRAWLVKVLTDRLQRESTPYESIS